MIKILLSGCSGAMGKTVAQAATIGTQYTVVAGIDRVATTQFDFPVFTQFDDIDVDFDVIIDFSNPKNLAPLLGYLQTSHKPVVIATTGFSQEQICDINDSASVAPIFFSANMSLGVSLLRELAVTAAKVLGEPFDIEIIEKHHNQKVDAPSGTALLLANAIAAALPHESKYTYDRHSSRVKRDSKEIGMHSVRGGTIVGEHDVIFAGQDEVITLSHTAYSKVIFAKGALSAAAFLATCANGIYDMSDLVQSV